MRTEHIAALARCGDPIEYADTAADDSAFLIYTSGTAGRPKGVLHSHRTAWGRRPMYHGWYGITADDIVLHAGAFNWTYTLGVGLIDPCANAVLGAAGYNFRLLLRWLALLFCALIHLILFFPPRADRTLSAARNT